MLMPFPMLQSVNQILKVRKTIRTALISLANLPTDDTPDNHLSNAERRCLKNSTDSHDCGTKDDALLATHALAYGEGNNRTYCTANSVD